jgi:hypothetical protein
MGGYAFIYLTDVPADEKDGLELYGRNIFYGVKRKGKDVAVYYDGYKLIILSLKEVILVLFSSTPDFLSLGSDIDWNLIPNDAGSGRLYRRARKAKFKTIAYGPNYNLHTIIREGSAEFVISRENQQPLVSTANLFNEIIKNQEAIDSTEDVPYPFLLCLSNTVSHSHPPFTLPTSQSSAFIKTRSKLLAMYKKAEANVTETGSLKSKKLLNGVLRSMHEEYGYPTTVYEIENADNYFGPFWSYNTIARFPSYQEVPDVDFILTQSDDRTTYTLYPRYEALGLYYDVTDPDNGAMLPVAGSVMYDADYFFDVSEIEIGLNIFDTPLADIDPGNVRYLFDIDTTTIDSLQAVFSRGTVSFYFEGSTLKYRPIRREGSGSLSFTMLISSFEVSDDVNFDTFVDFEANLLVSSGGLIDLATPPALSIEKRIVHDFSNADSAFSGDALYLWYNVLDNLTYERVLEVGEISSGHIASIANMTFTAPALPVNKTASMPLLCFMRVTGTLYTDFSTDYNYDNLVTTHCKIPFNGYITEVEYNSVFHTERTNSPTVTGSVHREFSGSGFTIEPVQTTYTISIDFFGAAVIRKETADALSSGSGFQDNGANATVSFYIVEEEVLANLTDARSLIDYIASEEPLTTITSTNEFESSSNWDVNAPKLRYAYSTFVDVNAEFYPIGYVSLTYYSQSFAFDSFNFISTGESDKISRIYGSYSQTNYFRSWIGRTPDADQNDFSGLTYLPNVYSLPTNMSYVSATNINSKRFHRIHLVDNDFNKVGRCDLIWSIKFQQAIDSFVKHQPESISIAIDKGTNETELTSTEVTTLTDAKTAYEDFNTTFLSDILYNDFMSYELMFYLFGIEPTLNDHDDNSVLSYSDSRKFMQDVIIVVTTAELAAAA